MPASPSIPQRSADEPPEQLARVLDEAGCLVVSGVLDADGRERLRQELTPHMEAARVAESDEPTDFYPGKTRRVTALVARSTMVGELILHPTPSALCEHHLGPNCEGYQLHVTAALSVGRLPEAQRRERLALDDRPSPTVPRDGPRP